VHWPHEEVGIPLCAACTVRETYNYEQGRTVLILNIAYMYALYLLPHCQSNAWSFMN
jgi:hypothetical protein